MIYGRLENRTSDVVKEYVPLVGAVMCNLRANVFIFVIDDGVEADSLF